MTVHDRDESRSFPPEVAVHLVKLACELPQLQSVPLALWDCAELARQLVTDKVVETISPDTVRRILRNNHLKPWRQHSWLSPTVPRDAAFGSSVRTTCELYTRPLGSHEIVLSIDEKTSIQPRGRTARTLPARPNEPVRVEHEYVRSGALNLFAAFDTRKGEIFGWNAELKRADEFISFLNYIDASLPPSFSAVYVVLDNLRVHKSRAVLAWLAQHPRFIFHFPPVHCSWLNQIEQWFSILQRKALRYLDFDSTLALDRYLHQFIARWNQSAHPFNWSTKSVAKVLAKCPPAEAVPDAHQFTYLA
jgi:transposase